MVPGCTLIWFRASMRSIREGEPDYTGRIVVIGTEIHEDELLKTFGL